MPILEIGAALLILFAIVAFGNLWFHFIESILERIKRLFSRRENSAAWHPFPSDEEKEE